ncbi:hypothetical protein JXA31_09185 [Candidatus Bathyarchaeota archaeon]|nr:hypothetical protein [Candidatus Bathyarchaeota archaeon]
MDRSPVDTLVDVAYDVRNESLIRRYIGKLYRCILPSCTFSLIFDAEPGTAINRKDDEHDIQQLTIKRRLYRRVAEINGLQVINTKRPVDVVHNEVVQYVGVHIGNVAGATVQ